jgi:hypothetical protein
MCVPTGNISNFLICLNLNGLGMIVQLSSTKLPCATCPTDKKLAMCCNECCMSATAGHLVYSDFVWEQDLIWFPEGVSTAIPQLAISSMTPGIAGPVLQDNNSMPFTTSNSPCRQSSVNHNQTRRATVCQSSIPHSKMPIGVIPNCIDLPRIGYQPSMLIPSRNLCNQYSEAADSWNSVVPTSILPCKTKLTKIIASPAIHFGISVCHFKLTC